MSGTVVIIQSRLGSTRLPGKAVLDLCGKPLIWHVVQRAKQIQGVDAVIVATPNRYDARVISAALEQTPVMAYEDVAESDVLRRYALAAAQFGARTIVRITGDCPLLNPQIADRVLQLFRVSAAKGSLYASNVAPGYIDGEDVEVFSWLTLMKANLEATEPDDREHVTPYIRRTWPNIATLPAASVTRAIKTSVDTLEDFNRVKKMLEANG